MKSVLTTILLSVNFGISSAQQLQNQEMGKINRIVGDFLHYYDTGAVRQSEIFVLIFQTDSVGKISSINILSDAKAQTYSYELLSRLTPKNFESWQAVNFPNGIISLPYYVMGNDEPATNNYADLLFRNFLWERQKPRGVAISDKDAALAAPDFYQAAQKRRIICATTPYIAIPRVDSTKL